MIYDVYTLAAKDGAWIQVQLAIQPGYRFQWSGRKDRRSQEWPQRLHAAFRGQGWKWPARRITAMARPAEGPPLGNEADLALAVGFCEGPDNGAHGPKEEDSWWANSTCMERFIPFRPPRPGNQPLRNSPGDAYHGS